MANQLTFQHPRFGPVVVTPGPDGWEAPAWPELAGDLELLLPLEEWHGPALGHYPANVLHAAAEKIRPVFPDVRVETESMHPAAPGTVY